MENCLLLTMISPPFVSALAFIMLFGRRGLITYGLLHISANPYGWQGIVILQVIGNLSFTALFLLTFFDGIDGRLIMASRDLGADSFHTLRLVILPAVRPGNAVGAVHAFHHESGRFWNTGGDRRKI